MSIEATSQINFKALGLQEPVNPQEAQKLWKASQAMESIFAKYLLTELGKVMPGSASTGNAVYADLFQQAVADKIAESNTLGLSKQIYMAVDNIARRTQEAENIMKTKLETQKQEAL